MRLLLILLLGACRSGLPVASLHGRVIVPGESAAGITVTAAGGQVASVVTGDNGEYLLTRLVLGGYTVSAGVASTVEGRGEVAVEADGATEVPDLIFTPTGELDGWATRGGAASGNAGILVSVDGTAASAVTDDAGHYHLAGVPTGSRDLRAQLSGFRAGSAAAQPIQWKQVTQVPEIDLVVSPGSAFLRGTTHLYGATDDSGTRVVVTGTGLEAVTAADGSWAVDGVPEGTYSISFDNGVYHETVPQVEALPGSDGFVIDGSLYPLPQSPLTLYASRRLQATRNSSGYLLSPDGTRFLYGEQLDSSLRSVMLDGSGAVTLARSWYGYFDGSTLGFSPDSFVVAFRSSQLEIIPAAGGTPTGIAWGVQNILFAPAGGLLGYLGIDSDLGTQALFVAPSLGGASKMLVSDPKMLYPTWSADGSHLLYRTNVDDYWMLGTVRLVAASGTAPVDIVSGAESPQVRADRRYALVRGNIDYDQGLSSLYSVDLTSGAVVQLGPASGHYDTPLFAGDRAVYGDNTTLYSIPLTGGTPLALDDGKTLYLPYNTRVSPDGSRVAYNSDCISYSLPCSLWTVPTAGGMPQLVDTGAFDFGFSSDGSRIWYTTGRDNQGVGDLWLASIGGTPQAVDSGVYSWATRFTPDNTRLLYAKDATNDNHGTLYLSGALLGRDVELSGWEPSPDGKHLFFVQKPAGGVRSLFLSSLDDNPVLPVLTDIANAAFTAKNALLAQISGTPAPYRFQDGFYLAQP